MKGTEYIIKLSDGRAFGVLEQGAKDGTPVIYLHGAPGSNKDHSQHSADSRLQNIRMFAINRPGTGNSTASDSWSALGFADDLREVMDRLAIAKANVVGFSAGGLYACAFAYRYPERVERLGLISSVAPFNNPVLYEKLTEATQVFYEGAKHNPAGLLAQLSAITSSEAMFALVESLVSPEDKRILNSPEVRESMLSAFSDVVQQGLKGFVKEIFNIAVPWGFSVSDISTETRIWHGRADHNIPVECGEYLAKTIPSAQLTYMDGAGHYFSFERWPDIIQSLLTKES